MAFILNIIIIVIILGVVIFVHEFGHLLACKLTKVYVEEFAIGMGPKIFSKKIGETLYSLRAFPIGGFNKIKGEEFEDGEEKDDDPRSLKNKGASVKILIFLSGVIMNVALAVAIFNFLFLINSFQWFIAPQYKDFGPVFGELKTEVFDDGVRYSTDLDIIPEEGHIMSINGVDMIYSYNVSDFLQDKKDSEVKLHICSDDCNDYIVPVDEKGHVGISIFNNFHTFVEYQGWERWVVGFVHLGNWGKLMGVAIGDIFAEASRTGDYEEVGMSLAGPIGLYVIIDYLRDLGFLPLLDMTANISLSIGFFNLLPIPALDGGRVFMLLTEVVSRRKLNRRFEAWAIQISFILLLLLMFLVLFKDIVYFDRLRDLLG